MVSSPESLALVAEKLRKSLEKCVALEWHHTGCGVCSEDGVAPFSYSKGSNKKKQEKVGLCPTFGDPPPPPPQYGTPLTNSPKKNFTLDIIH